MLVSYESIVILFWCVTVRQHELFVTCAMEKDVAQLISVFCLYIYSI